MRTLHAKLSSVTTTNKEHTIVCLREPTMLKYPFWACFFVTAQVFEFPHNVAPGPATGETVPEVSNHSLNSECSSRGVIVGTQSDGAGLFFQAAIARVADDVSHRATDVRALHLSAHRASQGVTHHSAQSPVFVGHFLRIHDDDFCGLQWVIDVHV